MAYRSDAADARATGKRATAACGVGCLVEPLDRRMMFSAAPVAGAASQTVSLPRAAVTRGLVAPAPLTLADELVPGGTILRTTETHVLPSTLPIRKQHKGNLNAFDIVLKKGPNLLANAAASAAFDAAAAFYEAILSDPITVVIDAEIAPLGPGILGSTGSVAFTASYAFIRNLVVADRAGDGSEAIAANLPTFAQFAAIVPNSPGNPYSLSGNLRANRANLLALGVAGNQLNGPTSVFDPGVRVDMSMTFSSNFAFDFDRSNGIAAGQFDFVGVAVHEIGHGLGFTSSVDIVDFLVGNPGGRAISPTTLDLFRLEPGNGPANFTAATRVLSPGNIVANQVLYDGGFFAPAGITTPAGLATGEIPFSTGRAFGDGQQGSHWKDNTTDGGVQIGIMDPTAIGTGQTMNWQLPDTRALGLIGWDVDLTPPSATSFAHLFQTAPNKIQYVFNDNVRNSFTLDDLSVQKVGGGVLTPASLTFNAAGTTATVTFPGTLPDARFTATLLASGAGGGILDLSGNQLAANRVDNFFFLQGDANHNASVGPDDFNLLAINFGLGGKTFADGDFDGDGVVGPNDFNLLAINFPKSI